MDVQLRMLADAVERNLSEPFTVRELAILSPYARANGRQQARHPAPDRGCSPQLTPRSEHRSLDAHSVGSVHEFKGLEAVAVILTDVDLQKGIHRDLLHVGASRATDRLLVLLAAPVDQS